jgi:hypothetical protein
MLPEVTDERRDEETDRHGVTSGIYLAIKIPITETKILRERLVDVSASDLIKRYRGLYAFKVRYLSATLTSYEPLVIFMSQRSDIAFSLILNIIVIAHSTYKNQPT